MGSQSVVQKSQGGEATFKILDAQTLIIPLQDETH